MAPHLPLLLSTLSTRHRCKSAYCCHSLTQHTCLLWCPIHFSLTLLVPRHGLRGRLEAHIYFLFKSKALSTVIQTYQQYTSGETCKPVMGGGGPQANRLFSSSKTNLATTGMHAFQHSSTVQPARPTQLASSAHTDSQPL